MFGPSKSWTERGAKRKYFLKLIIGQATEVFPLICFNVHTQYNVFLWVSIEIFNIFQDVEKNHFKMFQKNHGGKKIQEATKPKNLKYSCLKMALVIIFDSSDKQPKSNV